MFLRNHGTLTQGRSIAEAFTLMHYLERTCEIQVAAQTGGELALPSPAVIDPPSRRRRASATAASARSASRRMLREARPRGPELPRLSEEGMRLENKIAVVVGAGQSPGEGMGNGRATVLRFVQEGAKVLAVDRGLASARETAALAEKEGGECVPFEADVTKEATLAAAVQRR